jgi:hypothetical protein
MYPRHHFCAIPIGCLTDQNRKRRWAASSCFFAHSANAWHPFSNRQAMNMSEKLSFS